MMMNLPCLMASSTNFLRPICSYTECQLSFQTGSCPTEITTASYSSCLYLIVTDLLLYTRTDFQWTHFLALAVSLVDDAVPFTLHLGLRVSYPEPCPISDFLWNPARFWNFWCSLVLLMQPASLPELVLRYLPTISSDHMLSPSSGL